MMDREGDPIEEVVKAIESWIEALEKIERKLKLLASGSQGVT